jgi:flagellar export protein FliJ
MSKFQFRLDGLMKLRKHHEDMARQELADAERDLLKAREHLDGVVSQKTRASQDLCNSECAGNLIALQSGYNRVLQLSQIEAASRQRVSALDERHECRRVETLKAHQAHQTLQHLHDRYLQRHLDELRREESNRTDEAGAQMAARRIIEDRPDAH